MRVFGPPAAILVLTGLGKLIYDLVDKDFRVADQIAQSRSDSI
jgi:hypothetical protein